MLSDLPNFEMPQFPRFIAPNVSPFPEFFLKSHLLRIHVTESNAFFTSANIFIISVHTDVVSHVLDNSFLGWMSQKETH